MLWSQQLEVHAMLPPRYLFEEAPRPPDAFTLPSSRWSQHAFSVWLTQRSLLPGGSTNIHIPGLFGTAVANVMQVCQLLRIGLQALALDSAEPCIYRLCRQLCVHSFTNGFLLCCQHLCTCCIARRCNQCRVATSAYHIVTPSCPVKRPQCRA